MTKSKTIKPVKNTKETVFATKYPNLFRHVTNFLSDACNVKPERIKESAKLSEIGLTADDAAELAMNLTAVVTSGSVEVPELNVKLRDVLDTVTKSMSFQDID
jgi:hypothetical protein